MKASLLTPDVSLLMRPGRGLDWLARPAVSSNKLRSRLVERS